jgi:hypothetical protein
VTVSGARGVIRRASRGVRRSWGLLEALAGHVEEAVVALLHLLQHL